MEINNIRKNAAYNKKGKVEFLADVKIGEKMYTLKLHHNLKNNREVEDIEDLVEATFGELLKKGNLQSLANIKFKANLDGEDAGNPEVIENYEPKKKGDKKLNDWKTKPNHDFPAQMVAKYFEGLLLDQSKKPKNPDEHQTGKPAIDSSSTIRTASVSLSQIAQIEKAQKKSEDDMKALQQNIEEDKFAREALKKQQEEASAEIKKLKDELQKLRSLADNKNGLSGSAKRENEQIRAVAESLSKQLAERNDALAERNDALSELNNEIQKLRSLADNNKGLSESANRENEQMRAAGEALRNQLAERNDELNELNNEIQKLRNLADNNRGLSESANRENEQMRAAVEALSKQLAERNDALSERNDALNELKNEIQKLRNLADNNRGLSESANRENEQMRAAEESLSKQLAERNDALSELNNEIQKLRSLADNNKGPIESARSKNEQMQAVEELKAKIEEQEKQLRILTDLLNSNEKAASAEKQQLRESSAAVPTREAAAARPTPNQTPKPGTTAAPRRPTPSTMPHTQQNESMSASINPPLPAAKKSPAASSPKAAIPKKAAAGKSSPPMSEQDEKHIEAIRKAENFDSLPQETKDRIRLAEERLKLPSEKQIGEAKAFLDLNKQNLEVLKAQFNKKLFPKMRIIGINWGNLAEHYHILDLTKKKKMENYSNLNAEIAKTNTKISDYEKKKVTSVGEKKLKEEIIKVLWEAAELGYWKAPTEK